MVILHNFPQSINIIQYSHPNFFSIKDMKIGITNWFELLFSLSDAEVLYHTLVSSLTNNKTKT